MSYEYYITPQEYATAQQNGISYSSVSNRVRNLGWTVERAITEPYRKTRSLLEWRKIADANGIGYEAFRSRLHRGWSVEDAATKPVFDVAVQCRELSQNQRKYQGKHIDEALEKIGITYAVFSRRMRDGWNMELALSTKRMTKSEAAKKGRRGSYWTRGPRLLGKEGVRV